MWPLLMNVWHGLRGLQDRLGFVPLHRMLRVSLLMAATASKSRTNTRALYPVDWPEVQLGDWLKDNLPSGIVGFDPWLHSARDIKSLEQDLRGTGITVQAVTI